MARNTPGTRFSSSASGDSGSDFRSERKGIFRSEGEYWSIGYGEHSIRLRNTRGLAYIAHLLRHPDTEFHVLDLFGGIASQSEEDEITNWAPHSPRGNGGLVKAGMPITGLSDAGEKFDEQAKAAYSRRLSQLREELAEAKDLGNVERAEQAENEIDALMRELSHALRLGGGNRRGASASERARQSVTKSMKSVIGRIVQSNATLGDLFSRCIKTGTFCSYHPDTDFPIAWEFAETLIQPPERTPSNGESIPASADPQTTPLVLDVSPYSLAERTPFVGRETERAAIRAKIDCALNGQGSLVMLGGGPGVGKSRLAMEMAEYASQVGFQCVVGHCYERDEPFPYLPFVEIIESRLAQAASLDDFRRRLGDNAAELAQLAPSLRQALPDIPRSLELPPAEKRRFLFQSVSAALAHAARTRSYVLIFEDLHWADESTLALLIHIANRVAHVPVVIIGTYRDGDLDGNPALVRSLEELIRMGIRPLKVGGLSRDAVGRMLDGLSERQAPESLADIIFDESQGNPFFVEELYRHLLEEGKLFDVKGQLRADITSDEIDVPENVRLIIRRRLERLDENEKQVLAAAAMIGRSFGFQLLSEIGQIGVDELFTVIEKTQRMGIIVSSAEGPKRPFTFGHELVRQTLLVDISVPRQQRLHATVAYAIERLYPAALNGRAGDIADHLLKAGPFADGRKLVHYLTLAGNSALDAAAFEEARSSFSCALTHLTEVDDRERACSLARLAIAERGLEHWEPAFTHLKAAVDIYFTLGDREMIARSCSALTDSLFWAGHFRDGADVAARGLAYLEGDVSADRARLLASVGQNHAAAGCYEPAHAALEEALNIASQLSDPNLMARLLGARSIVNYHFLRLREAAADGEKSGGSEVPPWDRAIQLLALHQTLLYLGRPEESARIRDELEPLAVKIGQSYSTARCLITRAWAEFGRASDLTKLGSVIREVFTSGSKVPFVFWDVFSGVQLSLIDFFQGNGANALLHAQASYRLEEESSFRGIGLGTLFRQMAYAGDQTGALAILEEKRPWLPQGGRPNTMGSWWMLALVIEGLFILGERSQAAELYPLARELVDTGAVALWPIFRFTDTVAGIAASAGRQWEVAEDHFQTAMQHAESFPYHLEQAEIRRFHAMMLLDRAGQGDHERARGLLRQARETYEQIGMRAHREMIQTLLR